jgi:hypothetical protein
MIYGIALIPTEVGTVYEPMASDCKALLLEASQRRPAIPPTATMPKRASATLTGSDRACICRLSKAAQPLTPPALKSIQMSMLAHQWLQFPRHQSGASYFAFAILHWAFDIPSFANLFVFAPFLAHTGCHEVTRV